MTSMTGLSSMDHGTRVMVSVSGPLASITLFFSLHADFKKFNQTYVFLLSEYLI